MGAHEREIDVRISGEEWDIQDDKAERLVREVLQALEEHLGPLRAGVLEVWFAADQDLHALNHEFRGKDMPTNVLSFASPAGLQTGHCKHFGQLALADGVCAREAKMRGIALGDHTRHLVLHGLLHLQGYDHEAAHDATVMETVERDVMEILDLHDPYLLTGEVHV